jgi:hypothetical protein
MSESYFLESKASGTWEYEIQEEKAKVNYPVVLGFNEIPESHRKTLEADPGYQARIKKGIYKEIKQKGKAGAENAIKAKDTKAIDAAKDAKEAKELYKGKVLEMKEELKKTLKEEKAAFNLKLQDMVDLRGEALNKIKDLEADKIKALGENAGVESGLKIELKLEKDKNTELNGELEKVKKSFKGEKTALENGLEDLKTSSKKEVDGLKTSHVKEIEKLKAEIKKLKEAK